MCSALFLAIDISGIFVLCFKLAVVSAREWLAQIIFALAGITVSLQWQWQCKIVCSFKCLLEGRGHFYLQLSAETVGQIVSYGCTWAMIS